MTIMKSPLGIFLFTLSVVVSGVAQQDAGGFQIKWQDPWVKILGDVAHGPGLEPITSVGGNSTFPPWGPRIQPAGGSLRNLSSRGYVTGDERTLIGGFVVGAGGRIVLIRAIGPSLSAYGVTSCLARPHLRLFDANGNLIATAVPWSSTQADTQIELSAAAESVGAFPLQQGSADAVLLAYLQPGVYTAIVSGEDASSGEVLLEVYHVETEPSNIY